MSEAPREEKESRALQPCKRVRRAKIPPQGVAARSGRAAGIPLHSYGRGAVGRERKKVAREELRAVKTNDGT